MEAEIGTAAGALWQYLDQHGRTGASKLRKETALPDALFYMALGWLAREGQIQLTQDKRSLVVDLRR
jgi:hypothetical protein